MKTAVNAIAIAVLLESIVGCGESEQNGGGSRGIIAGPIARAAVYGIRPEAQLRFVMFTDIPSESTIVSAHSTWIGRV